VGEECRVMRRRSASPVMPIKWGRDVVPSTWKRKEE